MEARAATLADRCLQHLAVALGMEPRQRHTASDALQTWRATTRALRRQHLHREECQVLWQQVRRVQEPAMLE